MMGKKYIGLVLIALMALASCSESNEHCNTQVVMKNNMELHIQPYSVTEMIRSEIKSGLHKNVNVNERRKELSKYVHLRIKIMNGTNWDQGKREYLDHAFKYDVTASIDGLETNQSLFINETSFSGGNMVQYFLAYDAAHQDDRSIDIKVQSTELGFDQELFSFDLSCFQ